MPMKAPVKEPCSPRPPSSEITLASRTGPTGSHSPSFDRRTAAGEIDLGSEADLSLSRQNNWRGKRKGQVEIRPVSRTGHDGEHASVPRIVAHRQKMEFVAVVVVHSPAACWNVVGVKSSSVSARSAKSSCRRATSACSNHEPIDSRPMRRKAPGRSVSEKMRSGNGVRSHWKSLGKFAAGEVVAHGVRPLDPRHSPSALRPSTAGTGPPPASRSQPSAPHTHFWIAVSRPSGERRMPGSGREHRCVW